MPCRPLAAPHRQPQLSLWSARLRQGVSVCYQKKTGWNRMVSACFLRSCFFGSVPPAMRGHSGLPCVRSNGLLCVGHSGLSCVRSIGLPCVRSNGFPCVRHNGLPYVRGGAGGPHRGRPSRYWWGRPQACPWACLLFAGDMAVRLHAAGRRQTFSISNSAFSTIHSCGKYCMMFHTEMPRRQYSFASSSFARIDRASSNHTSCSAFIFQ